MLKKTTTEALGRTRYLRSIVWPFSYRYDLSMLRKALVKAGYLRVSGSSSIEP
jgi:hypothetical protein